MKNRFSYRVGSEEQYGPRLVGEILHDYLENSDDALAVAYREQHHDVAESHLFRDYFPNTELDVDLKLITRLPGRLDVGSHLNGVLVHVDEDQFTFLQHGLEKRMTMAEHRNPHVYNGSRINVTQREDGSLQPTFNRPRYNEDFTFQDFCREAAEELLLVGGLLGKNTVTE